MMGFYLFKIVYVLWKFRLCFLIAKHRLLMAGNSSIVNKVKGRVFSPVQQLGSYIEKLVLGTVTFKSRTHTEVTACDYMPNLPTIQVKELHNCYTPKN